MVYISNQVFSIKLQSKLKNKEKVYFRAMETKDGKDAQSMCLKMYEITEVQNTTPITP